MNTFIDIMRARAQQEPHACAYAFVKDDGSETRLTYAELELRARAVAAHLQRIGAAGERVLIVLQPGLDYVVAVFGCLFAGSTMVPCARPGRVDRAGQLRAVALDSGAKFAFGGHPFSEDPAFPPLKWTDIEAAKPEDADDWREPSSNAGHVALIQYTSGSTASPRGVMVTHANLLANAGSLSQVLGHPKHVWGVTWLPPYHDLGLMGGILQPVFCDAPTAVISPMDFLRRPALWLETVSRYRARTSGGPNFAYDLCVRSVSPEKSSHLLLDCWELAYVGAEPVRAATLDLFARTFAPCGFRRDSFFPSYGLAEATLCVSGGRVAVACLSAEGLRENRVIESSEPETDARVIVSCGTPASTLNVAIVDPETELTCDPGRIGEIWVSGSGIASGYWMRPEETRSVFHAALSGHHEGAFLRTGDLGFVRNGELFVTGRIKDLIIVRGRNHYPQDIEDTVAGVSQAIRPGSCAAFSVDSGSEERLVLILEMPRPRPENVDLLEGDIRQAVAGTHQLQVSTLLLVRPGSIPKTSSGKVKRLKCRNQYVSGALQGLEGA